jgi:hypothetical protein
MGQNNVATFQLASGYGKFAAFHTEAEVDYEKEQNDPIMVKSSQLVSDKEDTDNYDKVGSDKPEMTEWCEPVRTHFDLNQSTTTEGKILPTSLLAMKKIGSQQKCGSQTTLVVHGWLAKYRNSKY